MTWPARPALTRDREVGSFGRLEVDHQIQPRRLFNREISGLRALEDLDHLPGERDDRANAAPGALLLALAEEPIDDTVTEEEMAQLRGVFARPGREMFDGIPALEIAEICSAIRTWWNRIGKLGL